MVATKKEAQELDALADAWEKKRGGKSLAGKSFSLDEFVKAKVSTTSTSTR